MNPLLAVGPITVAWAFYAFGPQLVICMVFGYLAAKKTGGSRLDWLTGAFLASLVPIAGVVLMWWLWWRSPAVAGPPAAEKPPT